jgi:hypothetical protein
MQAPEVGGLQNTATNIGASLGTALAGSVLIAGLTTALLTGIQQDPAISAAVKQQAQVELSSGVPFVSDADARAALEKAGVSDSEADAIVADNETARLKALRAALAVIAIVAAVALAFAGGIPTRQPGSEPSPASERGQPDLAPAGT